MNFLIRPGLARRLYLLSFALIACLVVVANAAWVSLTEVDSLARESLHGAQVPVDALAKISRDALDARTRLSAMVVAVAMGMLAFSCYISRLLLHRIAVAQSMAEKVRDGDLTRNAADSRRDEFQPLMQELGSMQHTLLGTVQGVRASAERIAVASAEIAKGNRELSQRTEEQVLALKLTVQSMTDISEIVRANAKGAERVRQLAQGASNAAEHAAQVIEQVVDEMCDIDEGARSIVQIIAVIDGLAFQTSILALNAAVEAARAGTRGNGFAVVAGEVQVLAQRSAQAAKQIQNLVNTSVERSGQGSALVEKAGAAMRDVSIAIAQATRIAEDISVASQAQSTTLHQLSETVQQMDRSNHANATLVEEIATAAQWLRNQADEQVQNVAVFQLEHS